MSASDLLADWAKDMGVPLDELRQWKREDWLRHLDARNAEVVSAEAELAVTTEVVDHLEEPIPLSAQRWIRVVCEDIQRTHAAMPNRDWITEDELDALIDKCAEPHLADMPEDAKRYFTRKGMENLLAEFIAGGAA